MQVKSKLDQMKYEITKYNGVDSKHGKSMDNANSAKSVDSLADEMLRNVINAISLPNHVLLK